MQSGCAPGLELCVSLHVRCVWVFVPLEGRAMSVCVCVVGVGVGVHATQRLCV